MTEINRLGAELGDLVTDVDAGPRSAEDDDRFVGELLRLPVVVAVQHAARESLDARDLRHSRFKEVPETLRNINIMTQLNVSL